MKNVRYPRCLWHAIEATSVLDRVNYESPLFAFRDERYHSNLMTSKHWPHVRSSDGTVSTFVDLFLADASLEAVDYALSHRETQRVGFFLNNVNSRQSGLVVLAEEDNTCSPRSIHTVQTMGVGWSSTVKVIIPGVVRVSLRKRGFISTLPIVHGENATRARECRSLWFLSLARLKTDSVYSTTFGPLTTKFQIFVFILSHLHSYPWRTRSE